MPPLRINPESSQPCLDHHAQKPLHGEKLDLAADQLRDSAMQTQPAWPRRVHWSHRVSKEAGGSGKIQDWHSNSVRLGWTVLVQCVSTHTRGHTHTHTRRTAAGARPLRNSDVTERMKELVCVVMHLYRWGLCMCAANGQVCVCCVRRLKRRRLWDVSSSSSTCSDMWELKKTNKQNSSVQLHFPWFLFLQQQLLSDSEVLL